MSVHYDRQRRRHVVRWRDENGVNRKRSFPGDAQGKRDAQAFDYEIKRRKKRGEVLPGAGRGVYLDELAQLWINAKIAEGRSRGWISNWARILNRYFIPALTLVPVEDLSYDELVSFVMQKYPQMRGRQLSQSTSNRYLNYLKMMFNFGVAHGHLRRNPLARWRAPKEQPRQPMLTIADLRRIYLHAAPHLQWALEVEWSLGVRAGTSELLSLQWQMIDWEDASIRVYGRKTKTWRRIPIALGFLQRLRQRQAQSRSLYIVEYCGRPVKSLRRSLATACRRAGISYDVRLTDLRHLFATVLLRGGADLKAVSQLLGHSSTKMTADQYYFYLEGEKRQAMASLPPLGESGGGEHFGEHFALEGGKKRVLGMTSR